MVTAVVLILGWAALLVLAALCSVVSRAFSDAFRALERGLIDVEIETEDE